MGYLLSLRGTVLFAFSLNLCWVMFDEPKLYIVCCSSHVWLVYDLLYNLYFSYILRIQIKKLENIIINIFYLFPQLTNKNSDYISLFTV